MRATSRETKLLPGEFFGSIACPAMHLGSFNFTGVTAVGGRRVTVAAPLDLRIGDRLRLRKEHPCGSRDWDVVRLGADIGLSAPAAAIGS